MNYVFMKYNHISIGTIQPYNFSHLPFDTIVLCDMARASAYRAKVSKVST